MSALNYRPEIDGLRAVAVVSVLGFHAFPERISGGYVGVDVFFVISGFLICTIIAKSITESRFSLLDFYERRARRILPPLAMVLVFVLAVGSFVMLPDEFADLGVSTIATSIFVANFYFWEQASDYFSGTAEYAPLLHTWSLGVEEQFYIIAPPVLYITIRKFGNIGAFWTIFALSLASLIMSISFSRDFANMSFYLPFTRFHELGIGALLALAPTARMPPKALREAMSAAGFTMMVAAIFLFDSSTIFPGVAALFPCIGTGLIIFSAQNDTLVGRLLSLRPIVFVGLLSYSLYLWHWPFLAFARHYTASVELAPLVVLGCMASASLMALLSLKYVETPFRSRSLASTQKAMLSYCGGALATVVVVGGAIELSDGYPNRFSAEVRQIADVMTDINRADKAICDTKGSVQLCQNSLMAYGQPPEVIFLGDSHARASAPFVLGALSEEEVAAMALWRGGCPPIPEVHRTSRGSTDQDCPDLVQQLWSELDTYSEVHVVVLHARWALYGTGEPPFSERGGPVLLSKANDELNRDPRLNFPILTSRLPFLLDEISNRGLELVILGSVPEIGWNVPKALASHVRFGVGLPDSPDGALFGPAYRGRTDAWLESYVADRTGATYVSTVPAFCTPICEIWDGLTPYYWDSNHLSWRGAEILSEIVVEEIMNALE